MKLVCAADLHMGRRSTRLPRRADGRACSCSAVWARVVDHAIETGADAVLLAGDVVERKNRYFEAIGPLERGIRRLAGAGVPVVAVAGNHDFDVLPDLAGALGGEGLRLLGRGERWERAVVETRSGPLAIDGWSFERERVPDDPLRGYDLPGPSDDSPLVGLLHADLDRPGSPYAPVSLADLRRLPPRFWLLGHVHSPALHQDPDDDGAPAPVLYPGSPQAMDPGEPGPHGAWTVELEPGRPPRARRVPLSTVRYEAVEVDVDGVDDEDDARRRVVGAVRARRDAAAEEGGPLRWLCCRVTLTGRTPLHRRLERAFAGASEDLELAAGDVAAVVEKVEVATRPALDLEVLARGRDPCAVLARLLREALNDDGRGEAQEPYRALLRDASAAAAEAHGAAPYRALPDDPPAKAETRRLLREQAWLLLDALRAQRDVEVEA